MAGFSSSYKLKRFASSHDPEFAQALLLYVRNTPATSRTESNEIAFWLEEFPKRKGPEFHVFGFYRDDQLVGFAQVAYFPTERLLVFDYLALDASQRKNNVFYEFVDHLRTYIEDTHPEYRYVVAECCYGPGHDYPSHETRLIIRLLKLQGFQVIRAPYFQPRLLLNDPESEMRADLLVYSAAPIDRMQVETYLGIVKTIYFEHYLPWNCGILEDPQAYEEHLTGLYDRIEESLKGKKTIDVNGHKTFLNAPDGSPKEDPRVVVFAVQALAAIVVLTAAMLGLKFVFKLSDYSFATIYALAVCSFIAVAGIVSKHARTMFSELVGLAKHIWPKRNTSPGQRTLPSRTAPSKPPRGATKARGKIQD